MNTKWDGGDVAFRSETWAAIGRCLYPGAFGMAFASTRGLHRVMVAVEDAGFVIHPIIMYWGFGSGFPKATRVPDARFSGHRYGLQAIKPSLEPVIVFQKPYEGKPVDCITRTGAGALWIDGARIGTGEDDPNLRYNLVSHKGGGYNSMPADTTDHGPAAGRWPANLVLTHSPLCERTGMRRVRGDKRPAGGTGGIWSTESNIPVAGGKADPDGYETVADWACHPDCAVAALGRQSGESEARASMRGLQVSGAHGGLVEGSGKIKEGTNSLRGHSDSGTAARFFFQADYMYERLEAADAVAYFAKASRSEREAGLDPRQVALMRMIEGEQWEDFEGAPPERAAIPDRRCQKCGGWYPTMARHRPNSTCHCDEPDFVSVDFPEMTVDDGRQTPIDNPYLRGETTRRNTHPCIKPVSLCKWLSTLLAPPVEYAPRRLLIPFCGTGSEYIGALLSGGWEEITGIELSEEYAKIAEARISYWKQRKNEFVSPHAPVKVRPASKTSEDQLEMF